jgi:hypothetical protein
MANPLKKLGSLFKGAPKVAHVGVLAACDLLIDQRERAEAATE